MKIIEKALKDGRTSLSEYDAKQVLATYQIPVRVAPLEKRDALEMMKEIKAQKILEAVRGMPAADVDMLADILINVGRIGLENEQVKEIDINPVIIAGSRPVAVDALIILDKVGK